MADIEDADGRAAVWPKIGVDDPERTYAAQICCAAQGSFDP
jgi:hypothetical protein